MTWVFVEPSPVGCSAVQVNENIYQREHADALAVSSACAATLADLKN